MREGRRGSGEGVNQKNHAYYLEVGGGVGGGRLCLPVEVTEVGGLRHEPLLPLEVRFEVFRLEAMGVVDVPAHLRTKQDDTPVYACTRTNTPAVSPAVSSAVRGRERRARGG